MSKSVLVTGATGQVGSELHALSELYPQYQMTFANRDILDLSNLCKLEDFFDNTVYDIIINCAAYTAVDKAENEPEEADAINNRGVNLLAKIANNKNISLVHISTDYVFDGTNYKPYEETDKTNPQSVYGRTKLDGENAILKVAAKNTIIIRTSWVYSSFGNNFVKTMLRLGKEKDELGVVIDQIGTPTYARDLAKTILDILPSIKNDAPEIYHYSNEGVCSWFDFAKAIFDMKDIDCVVNAIETSEYPTPAKRPHYSTLSKTKIKQAFNLDIPYWRDSLKDALERMEK